MFGNQQQGVDEEYWLSRKGIALDFWLLQVWSGAKYKDMKQPSAHNHQLHNEEHHFTLPLF
jgi:hypothetical protein